VSSRIGGDDDGKIVGGKAELGWDAGIRWARLRCFPLDAAAVPDESPAMRKVITLISLLFPCAMAFALEPVNISPKEAAAWLAKTPDAQVLDVRTQKEFSSGHLAKAVMITWGNDDFEARARKLDAKKPVLIYCRSGRRSAAASQVLAKLGFTTIRNLDGGIVAWEKAGKPVTKSE
jgi:rhodanese-related sulfurtransferase